MDTSIRAGLTFGLTAAGMVAGTNACMSIFAVPPMLLAPKQLMVQQWRKLFDLGIKVMPPTAVLASASLAYVAYTCRSASEREFGDVGGTGPGWKGIALAAAAVGSFVPYTIIFMNSTNVALIAESNGAGQLAEGEVQALVERWSRLNLGRALLAMIAAVVGTWSALGLR